MRCFLWTRVISSSHLRDSDSMQSLPGLIAGVSGTLRVVSSCQTLGRSCSLTQVHYRLCCCFAESLLRSRSSQIEASCVRTVWGSLHRSHLRVGRVWEKEVKASLWWDLPVSRGGSGNDLLNSALWTQTAKSAVASKSLWFCVHMSNLCGTSPLKSQPRW